MSNVCLEVTIGKNWHTQNFNFLSLKSLCPGKLLESSNSYIYHWVFKLPVATYKSEMWQQNCV